MGGSDEQDRALTARNGCAEITSTGGFAGTGTTGRAVANVAMVGPKNRAKASRGQIIRPHNAKRDGVMDIAIRHPPGAEVPGLLARCVQNILKRVNQPLPA